MIEQNTETINDNNNEHIIIDISHNEDISDLTNSSEHNANENSLYNLLSLSSSSKPSMHFNQQNTYQRLHACFYFLIELYKVLISSFLLVFVPQRCGNHACEFNERISIDNDTLYSAGIIINFITMLKFMLLYAVELYRENMLITYLNVNEKLPNDNKSVAKVIDRLPLIYKNNILIVDKLYQIFGFTTMCVYTINTILSGIIIYDNYLDNKTIMTFVTNNIFMVLKLSDIFNVINTKQNIFYSAYLKANIQYNDIDDKYADIMDSSYSSESSYSNYTIEKTKTNTKTNTKKDLVKQTSAFIEMSEIYVSPEECGDFINEMSIPDFVNNQLAILDKF